MCKLPIELFVAHFKSFSAHFYQSFERGDHNWVSVLLNQLRDPTEVREEQETIEGTTILLHPDITKRVNIFKQVLSYVVEIPIKIYKFLQVIPQDRNFLLFLLNFVAYELRLGIFKRSIRNKIGTAHV